MIRSFHSSQIAIAALLVKCLDGVAQELPDLLMRAFNKLVQVSLPLLFRVWGCDCHDKDLQTILEKSIFYLFGFRSQKEYEETEDVMMEEECTELSLFDGLQTKGEKPKTALPLPSQVFQTMALNNQKKLDLTLFADIIGFANFLSDGRLMTDKATTKDI
jgi:hypothetical protein